MSPPAHQFSVHWRRHLFCVLSPGESQDKEVRYLDIHEGETVDASAFKTLVRQAVALNEVEK